MKRQPKPPKPWIETHTVQLLFIAIFLSILVMFLIGFPYVKNQDIPYAIIVALIVAIITCYEKWKKETVKDYFKNNVTAGSLLIAAFWALFFVYRADIKTQTEKVTINDLNKKLQDSIINQSNELINSVSAKDSYVILELVNVDKINKVGNLMPVGIGKHPVKLFSYYVYDLDTQQTIYSSSYTDITVFPQMTGAYNPNIKLPINLNRGVKWNIFILMSGGSFCEQIKFDYVNHTGSVKLYDNNFFKSNKNAGKCVYSNDSYKKS